MKLPKDLNVYFNQSFDKKRLKALISWVFKKSGEAEALRVLDLLKETGFKNATKAGISIGLHDLTTPVTKSWLISESQQSMNSTEIDFIGAKITATERSQRIIDTWHRASESLSKQVVNYFSIYDRFNPVYIMALSGARGNFSQVRQLIGMRGLMADQQGKIVNFPIRSNLREGLTITEYFISCSGARKGLVDTALRTADTGYLTRRLVDVSHHVVVKRIRCNTSRGIQFKDLQSYNKILLSLKERLVGRVLAENISVNDNLLAKKDREISPKLSAEITRYKNQVLIRSPLTCSFTHEVCQLCYGWSISQGSLVPLGDAVGVIAAQSIGEPGTQLTMRTFHTGGVFSGDLLQEIRAPHPGTIEFSKAFQGLLIRTGHGRIAFLSKTPGSLVLKDHLNSTTIPIQPFTMLFVRQGEKVEVNQLLAEFSIQSKEGNQPIKTQQTIFAELSGRVIEDCSGKTYLKYLKESSFLVDNLQHYLSSLVTFPLKTVSPKICMATKGISFAQKQSNAINQFLTLYKTEDIENDTFRYVEPVKAGRLGLLKILSIRIGATFNYTCPITLSGFSKYLQNSLCKSNHRLEKRPYSYKVNRICMALRAKQFEARITSGERKDTSFCASFSHAPYSSVVENRCKEVVRVPRNQRQTHAPFKCKKVHQEGDTCKSKICKAVAVRQKHSANLINRRLNLCGGLRKKSRLTRYLHPGLVKDNQFILQTIAEYGDIVEEEYKNKI